MIHLCGFRKKGSHLRIYKLYLSSHSVRKDRGSRKDSNSRNLSGSCLRLWNSSLNSGRFQISCMACGYPPLSPQGSNPMELLSLPIPTGSGGSCGSPRVTHWSPASTAFTSKTQTKAVTTSSCGKEGERPWAQPPAAPGCGGTRLGLRAWPGHCEDLLDHLAPTSLKKTFIPSNIFSKVLSSLAESCHKWWFFHNFPWEAAPSCKGPQSQTISCSSVNICFGSVPLLLVISSRTTLTSLTLSKNFWELKFVLPRQEKGSK